MWSISPKKIAEPLRNAEEKITTEKEEDSCQGKLDGEEVSSGKEVLLCVKDF